MRKLYVALLTSLTIACSSPHHGPTGDDDGGTVATAQLPQAIGGAMWVDPDAYPAIPLHVAVTGDAIAASVSIDGAAAVDATADPDGGGGWTAQVPVAALADGMHAVVATASGASGPTVTATAQLGVGHAGMQWTHFATDQVAATPRLHHVGDQLVLTWSDISTGTRVDWLQPIDGAGRPLADRVALVGGADQEDILYARTVFGSSTIGVMYQERGDPYVDFFTIIGVDGTSKITPIALDPDGRVGSWGGDVAFDGTSYFVTWRTAAGPGLFDVRWMKIDEATGATVGPIVVAVPGNDDPHGGFDAISNVGVRSFGDGTSAVAFSRYEYDPQLQSEILRCEYATVGGDGTLVRTELGAVGSDLVWSVECRILDGLGGPVGVWGMTDLTSTDDNPPVGLYTAAFASDALAADRGNGHLIVSAPDQRGEPWLVPTPASPVMAWTDDRNYTTLGRIQLFAAPLDSTMTAGAAAIFDHARFLEGTADLNGAPLGTNAMITWLDERYGGNVNAPTPEVYLETIWQ